MKIVMIVNPRLELAEELCKAWNWKYRIWTRKGDTIFVTSPDELAKDERVNYVDENRN